MQNQLKVNRRMSSTARRLTRLPSLQFGVQMANSRLANGEPFDTVVSVHLLPYFFTLATVLTVWLSEQETQELDDAGKIIHHWGFVPINQSVSRAV